METLEQMIRDLIKPHRNIILEGPDNVGKTYIAKEIQRIYADKDYDFVHFSRETQNNFHNFNEAMLKPGYHVWDRGPYGQFVYQTSKEREDLKWMSVSDLHVLENNMKYPMFDTIVVYVTIDFDTCMYNCKIDSCDSHYTREYVKSLFDRFDRVFDTLANIDVIRFENPYKVDADQIETDRIGRIDWSSFPKIHAVDFDGCLAYTKFPEIISPNIELINEMISRREQGERIILWTTRTQGHLDAAVEYCKQYGLEFDAINANVKEVLDAGLNPRKVYVNGYYIDDHGRVEKAIGE